MRKIVLSRPDKIGDVILALPLAGVIKRQWPDAHVTFIGQPYTKDIINASQHVDEYIAYDDVVMNSALSDAGFDAIVHLLPNKAIAFKGMQAGIPIRIGSNRLWYHWVTCNHRLNQARRHSGKHQSELEAELLQPLGITPQNKEALYECLGFTPAAVALPDDVERHLNDEKPFKLILHPKSGGSAPEWPLNHYLQLVQNLPQEKFKIFITGTASEGSSIESACSELFEAENVIDLCGKLTLRQLLHFIDRSDGFVAASTGPLHVAAACGKKVLGLYSNYVSAHPNRWMPLGKKISVLTPCGLDIVASSKNNKSENLTLISVDDVAKIVQTWKV